jgi:hypothetical protein
MRQHVIHSRALRSRLFSCSPTTASSDGVPSYQLSGYTWCCPISSLPLAIVFVDRTIEIYALAQQIDCARGSLLNVELSEGHCFRLCSSSHLNPAIVPCVTL